MQGFVDQMAIGHRFSAAHARVGGDHDFWFRVVDARRQTRGGKATENDRVNSTDADRRQHGEHRLGNHRHIDQYPITLADALPFQDRGEGIDLGVKLAVGIGLAHVGLGRDEHQGRLALARREMAVDSVVAEIGAATHEPAGEWRVAVVEYLRKRSLPVDQGRTLAPERIRVDKRAAMRRGVGRGPVHDQCCVIGPRCRRRRGLRFCPAPYL